MSVIKPMIIEEIEKIGQLLSKTEIEEMMLFNNIANIPTLHVIPKKYKQK